MNADLENYHVIDDDPDEEFEYYPDATDSTRRGLGTQIYIRSLQWRNVMTETHNFWLYEVENEGTTSYDSVYFGLYADFKIGGDDDDVAGYNTRLDIAYCYDYENVGYPGGYSPVPVTCYGFLESPTLGYDGIDSDEDGLVDERRDSDAAVIYSVQLDTILMANWMKPVRQPRVTILRAGTGVEMRMVTGMVLKIKMVMVSGIWANR